MKNIVLALLELQTKRFLKKHKPKLIAITGSVGKTSTKLFAATVLNQRYRIMTHYGNHNTEFSVPLAIFDLPYPKNVRNPLVWLAILASMQKKIRAPFNYEIIILELGTNKPGDISRFRRYLRPDVAIVTAVAPEHMQFFSTLDAVAEEELSVINFSELAIINRDDIDSVFARYVQTENIDTYGTSGVAEYRYIVEDFDVNTGFQGKFVSPEFGEQPVTLRLVGEHNIKAAVAAATVGVKLGMPINEIIAGMQSIRPVSGRMQLLRGLEGAIIIDDTYNSSPKAALAALQTLYVLPAKQKIAILGSMNELGDFSKESHTQVGNACDPTLLDWVVTIGVEAEQYLAPAATSKGCQVRSFTSPYDAGAFVHSIMQPGAVVLAKGSQNGVFAEEAIKILLHATEEEKQLVRQTPDWLAIKKEQFSKFIDSDTKRRKKK